MPKTFKKINFHSVHQNGIFKKLPFCYEIGKVGNTDKKRCYTCINCNRPQLDKLQVFVGFDRQIYCKTCYPKIWHTPLPLESTSKIKAEPGDCSGCPRCGGKVFEAEKMACRSGWYHKMCFSCKICKRLMDYSTFVDYKVRFK